MDERNVLRVCRWGEDPSTPVVLEPKRSCGTYSDHHRKGCIGLHVSLMGVSRAVHLTTEDALRLSDLLRAMAATNATT